ALGALVRAGLAGIAEKLPLPPLIQQDPHDMGADKRRSLGIETLPATLDEALTRLENDAVVKNWFSPNLWQTYLAVKRKEIELGANLGPDEICEKYRNAY